MRILLPGGLGFVGSRLTKPLLSNGHQVAAIGRSREPAVLTNARFAFACPDIHSALKEIVNQ